MALASLDSLAAGALDFEDVMQKFGEWYYEDKYTPTGVMFDAGNTCTASIHRYVNYGISIDDCGMADEYSNGNGSLMRIYPFALICLCNRRMMSKWEEIIEKASAITHAHPRSVLGCKIYAEILFSVINHPEKESIKLALGRAMKKYKSFNEFLCYERIFSPDFENTPREKINSSGYVVDTLEAAIWCLLTTNDYKSCVLKAANLGDDTDTVAAVAGSIAGALYGYEAIPERWRSALLRRDYIEELCERAYEEWSDG
jgi:ADP-ribosylglycohydrolase